METIHLVTATNDSYARHLAVMLTSLLENKIAKNPLHVYIIDSQISPANKKKLKKVLQRFQVQLTLLTVDPSEYKGCQSRGHLTKEAFYRYSIPTLLDNQIKKALYLDCDLILKEDISKLWHVNIDNYHLAAVKVPEKYINWLDNNNLQIAKDSYFNSGVLLINLVKWRQDKIKEKVIKFIRTNDWRTPAGDQDAINAILHDKWLSLDPKWNYYSVLASELEIAPAIIHYAGRRKPWKDKNCQLKEEYLKYSSKTAWNN